MVASSRAKPVNLQYKVKKEVLNMVYDFEAQDFLGDQKNRLNTEWRNFYEGISDIVGVPGISADTKLVTKFCQTSKQRTHRELLSAEEKHFS